jgi:hypothetical protein
LKFERLEEDPFGDQHWQEPKAGKKKKAETENGIFRLWILGSNKATDR